MDKLKIAVMLALVGACVETARAQFQWFENFEDGLVGWNLYTQRGLANLSAAASEDPVLGEIAGWSGSNQTVARVGGQQFNGGIWTVITLPRGPGTYEVDGHWRAAAPPPTTGWWGHVVVLEGNSPPPETSDWVGPMIYSNSTFSSPGGWSGQISTTDPEVGGDPATFTTASGTITLVLRSGNGSGTSWVDFDDVWITPEPATAALLALAGLPLLRRRRQA